MKQFDYEKAVKKYNGIMFGMCYEHNTINTEYSEGTENWNVRDMVAEVDYVLSTYYESGHANADMKEDAPEQWEIDVAELKAFIKAYKPYISGIKCVSGRCSQYDN